MSQNSIIELYTDLATNPDKDFGWEKGLQNAMNHNYKKEWIDDIPNEIWEYCAAVGNPFEAGAIREGMNVLDIGCGAGVDLCVASILVGEKGAVKGVDVTPAMVDKARLHATLVKQPNVTANVGTFESLPSKNKSIDVVISNGAINLAPSKQNVFSEIYRVLKHGGYLTFSDMIKDENHSKNSCGGGESWADCVAGTLKCNDLIKMLEEAGFKEVKLLSKNHYKTSPSTIGATFSAKKV